MLPTYCSVTSAPVSISQPSCWHGIDLCWAYSEVLPGIRRQTRCVQRAWDVLHDALLRFALHPQRDAVQEPHAYLRTVVRHVLLDHAKTAARYVAWGDVAGASAQATDQPGDAQSQMDSWLPPAPSPEGLLELKQRLQAAQALLEALPPRCREVFWLFRMEGLRQSEIAERLGISVNMVERHVMRALLDLRAARQLVSN